MQKQIVYLIQIVLGLVLVVLILLQTKGSGLGSAFGSDFNFYGTKRGAERMLFSMTIVIATLFLLAAIVGVVF